MVGELLPRRTLEKEYFLEGDHHDETKLKYSSIKISFVGLSRYEKIADSVKTVLEIGWDNIHANI